MMPSSSDSDFSPKNKTRETATTTVEMVRMLRPERRVSARASCPTTSFAGTVP